MVTQESQKHLREVAIQKAEFTITGQPFHIHTTNPCMCVLLVGNLNCIASTLGFFETTTLYLRTNKEVLPRNWYQWWNLTITEARFPIALGNLFSPTR